MQKAPFAHCDACPNKGGVLVPPEIPEATKRKLVIVGEGPGTGDLKARKPFWDYSGRMLERGLKGIRLSRSQVHWTHAVLCGGREEDLKAASKCCGERLLHEIAGAKFVMPLGSWGLASLLGEKKKPQLLKWRGSVIEKNLVMGSNGSAAAMQFPISGSMPEGSSEGSTSVEHGGRVSKCSLTPIPLVLPSIHPSFILKAPKWGELLEIDMARVGRLIREPFCDPFEHPEHEFIISRSKETLEKTLPLLGPVISFDVETVGLGPTHTALVCLAVSDGKLTVVIPWSTATNGKDSWWNFPEDIALIISKNFASRTVVTQNGPAFDHIIAQRYGFEIRDFDDTLLLYHALNGHMPKNLAHIVTSYIDVPPWKQWDHAKDIETMWTYNARDALYTILAWQAMRGEIQDV